MTSATSATDSQFCTCRWLLGATIILTDIRECKMMVFWGLFHCLIKVFFSFDMLKERTACNFRVAGLCPGGPNLLALKMGFLSFIEKQEPAFSTLC